MMKLKNVLLPGAAALLLMSTSAQAGLQQSQQVKMSDTLTVAPENWFHFDPKETGVAGISTQLAYEELLKGKEPKQEVIVAVIDSGVDIEHEDLDDILWVNEDEIAGNGVDDDKNGYVDDVHGWNFIGGPDGQNVDNDTYELTRLYKSLSEKYKGKSAAEVTDKEEFAFYQEIKQTFEEKVSTIKERAAGFLGFYARYKDAQKQVSASLGEDFTEEELKAFKPEEDALKEAKAILEFAALNGLNEERMEEGNEYFSNMLEYSYNPEFDPRHIVGDNYSDVNDRYYGNNDVEGPDASHGTHVAGIIAAERDNGIGMNGIAAPVKIMAVRAVPNGDERDKDVANAIYYAVDNGADIINMSFGKAYSPQKEVVDAAVKYAEEKGVLLVHAAGNDGKDIDVESNFPTKRFLNSKDKADNWLEIGASSWGTDSTFVADFSNYGRKTVDLFAPGVDIYSTVPGSEYQSMSGTSMAAPVTTGVAALVMAYYPELSAEEVRKILLKSATNYRRDKVNLPGADPESENYIVRFKKLSDTGKVVNVYDALKRAEKKAN